MKVQKIICLLALVAGGLAFFYSLGIMTDLYDALFSTMRKADKTVTTVPGSYVYYEMQDFNKLFVKLCIVEILTAVFLFINNTNIRRRYYIGNYIAIAIYSIYSIGFVCWAHTQIEMYKAKFLQIDFDALKAHAEEWNTLYTDSTFWFDVHYFVLGLVLLLAVLHIVNMFWKISLMKSEALLLKGGKEVSE